MMTFEMRDIDPRGAVRDWGANRKAMNPPRLPTMKTISPAAHNYKYKRKERVSIRLGMVHGLNGLA